MPNDHQSKPTPAQPAETAKKKNCDDHLMPGLVPQLVDSFFTPRAYLTTRGVARRKRVYESAVNTALFRDLYQEVNDLRQIVSRRPVESETQSVRYQLPRLRRQA